MFFSLHLYDTIDFVRLGEKYVMRANEGEQTEKIQHTDRIRRLRRIIVALLICAVAVPVCVSIILAINYDRVRSDLVNAREDLEWYHNHYQERVLAVDEDTTMVLETSDEVREIPSDSEDEPGPDETVVEDDIRRVYLTFDDGPSIYTEEILDILDEYNVKATFFVVGKEESEYRSVYERIVNDGHSIGMHSYSHKYGEIYSSLDEFQVDLHKLQTFIYENTGVWTTLYRFPGGSSNTVSDVDMAVLIDYLNKSGITYFDWNVSCGDADTGKSVDEIVTNVVNGVAKYSNSVVLMHDAQDKHTTVEALPQIIEQIQQMDATVIVPITEDTLPVQHIKNK